MPISDLGVAGNWESGEVHWQISPGLRASNLMASFRLQESLQVLVIRVGDVEC